MWSVYKNLFILSYYTYIKAETYFILGDKWKSGGFTANRLEYFEKHGRLIVDLKKNNETKEKVLQSKIY